MAVYAFYLIALVVLVSALSVIMARNPVHSVLWLILALVVVYVGAVAVLFLFVVMMLDVDFVELKQGTLRYWPFAVLVGDFRGRDRARDRVRNHHQRFHL